MRPLEGEMHRIRRETKYFDEEPYKMPFENQEKKIMSREKAG